MPAASGYGGALRLGGDDLADLALRTIAASAPEDASAKTIAHRGAAPRVR
jgi:hypothetical protein